MGRPLALTIVVALGLAGAAAGYFAILAPQPTDNAAVTTTRPVWTEAKWPFPIDQWGTGRAFNCKPADCETGVMF